MANGATPGPQLNLRGGLVLDTVLDGIAIIVIGVFAIGCLGGLVYGIYDAWNFAWPILAVGAFILLLAWSLERLGR